MKKIFSLTTTSVSISGKNFNLNIVPQDAKHVASVSISYDNDFVSRQSDATGSSILVENRDRGGEVNISINQVSDYIRPLINYCKMAKVNLKESLVDIVIKDSIDDYTYTCTDCTLKKIPDYEKSETPSMRDFVFVTCRIDEN